MSERSRRRAALIVLLAVVAASVLAVTAGLPLLRHNAAEARCVATVPAPDGSPGGNGTASVQWELLPTPHWECTYTTEDGVSGAANLGWWG